MRTPPERVLTPVFPVEVGRTGLASFLFALVRPGDAKAATVDADILTLALPFGAKRIPIHEIESAGLTRGWFWGGTQIRHAFGRETVSGLSRHHARVLANALGAARLGWWRRALAAQAETLRSVHERLAQLEDPPRYMARSVFSDLERDAEKAAGELPLRWPGALSRTVEIRMLEGIRNFLKDPDGQRATTNNIFVTNELARSREFFDRIEARPLTDEQRRAVVADEDRNLVVAAAGSGKTSVIVAKAGWLLRKGYRQPSELLLLAFAKDAQKEMEERVRRRLGAEESAGLTVRTFHSLGMSIIGAVEGKRPTLAKVAEDDKALSALLKRIISDLLVDPRFSMIMLRWFEDHFAPYKSEHEFRTQGEYWEYVRANEIRSLKGDKVKSFEECEIANFLYLNGVPYEYERSYEHDTATPEKRQYQPDFYLPDAGIYIEHFGLNESGGTAPFIDREKYLQEMDWKRQLHAEYKTILIETFSHEKAAGRLIENLTAKLADHGVALSPIPPGEVFAVLDEQGRVDPFTRLIATFLRHYKGAQLSAEGSGPTGRDCSRPPAGQGLSRRIRGNLRALPGRTCSAAADRFPRHDQQGDGACGERTLPQPVRLRPRR